MTNTETLTVGTPVADVTSMRLGVVVAVDDVRGYQVRMHATPDVAHWYDADELVIRGEIVAVRDLEVGDVISIGRIRGRAFAAEIVAVAPYRDGVFEVFVRGTEPRERLLLGGSRSVVRGAR